MSRTLYGDNSHHIAESCFKALARALRDGGRDRSRARRTRIPSTKGTLEAADAADGSVHGTAEDAAARDPQRGAERRSSSSANGFPGGAFFVPPAVACRQRHVDRAARHGSVLVVIALDRPPGRGSALSDGVADDPRRSLLQSRDRLSRPMTSVAGRSARARLGARSACVAAGDTRRGRGALLRAGSRRRPAARARNRRRRCLPPADGAEPMRSASSRSGAAAMSVAIIDYGSGNLHSAAKAFERAARESGIDAEIEVTSDPGCRAPGRAHRAAGRRRLRRLPRGPERRARHVEALEEAVIARGKPFLGICVGMQLMATRGLEHGDDRASAGSPATSRRSSPAIRRSRSRIWAGTRSTVERRIRCSPASRPATDGPARLFRAFLSILRRATRATCRHRRLRRRRHRHGRRATTWPARQFHPEKSQALGLALIANFLRWRP